MTALPYIAEVQIAFATLWLVYRAAMHHGGRLALNRVWLLGMTALALLIPALTIRVWPAPETIAFFLDTPLTSSIATAPPPATFDIRRVYLAGVVVLLAVSAAQLIRLRRIIRTAQGRIDINGCACLQTERIGRAATFLHYILVNPAALDEAQLRQVVAHERAHVALRHSYDLLFAQIVCIALWWNPFVWLWKQSLREVHEYQADARVLAGGFDAGNYASLILQSLTGIRPGFASGFSYQLLKNRLVMIRKSNRGAAVRLLFALPVVAGLMLAFSCAARQPRPAVEPARVIAYDAQPPAGPETTPVARPVERLMRELHVTTDEGPLTGRAGRIEIDTAALGEAQRKYGEAQRQFREAQREYHETMRDYHQSMRVRHDSMTFEANRIRINGRFVHLDEEPLFIINGKEVAPGTISQLDANEIQRIDVLKDADAIAKYGERGRNGVILLTLKPATDKPAPDDVFFKVEQMPAFESGDLNAFRVWVQSNLRYPAAAAAAKEQGRVAAQFIVEKDGSVSNITIIQSPGQSFSDEVVRVIRSSPKWTPGKQKGRAVRVKYTIPVDFSVVE